MSVQLKTYIFFTVWLTWHSFCQTYSVKQEKHSLQQELACIIKKTFNITLHKCSGIFSRRNHSYSVKKINEFDKDGTRTIIKNIIKVNKTSQHIKHLLKSFRAATGVNIFQNKWIFHPGKVSCFGPFK